LAAAAFSDATLLAAFDAVLRLVTPGTGVEPGACAWTCTPGTAPQAKETNSKKNNATIKNLRDTISIS
jgi:hypothetical protein